MINDRIEALDVGILIVPFPEHFFFYLFIVMSLNNGKLYISVELQEPALCKWS